MAKKKQKKTARGPQGGTPRKARLWGGRFSGATDPAVEAFTESVSFDRRLAPCDIAASIAHARMLGRCGLIPAGDARAIERGLRALGRQIARGEFPWDPALEDVHTNIERALTDQIGPAGGRLHTARSRNDQVATATRLYLREQIDQAQGACARLVATLVRLARKEKKTLLPGYTHMQRAQPVTLAHHLLAYAQMFLRDGQRLGEIRRRVNVLPLGSGALAGSSFKLDRAFLARELGFDGLSENSIDAVSDRDYQVEFLAAAALSGIHLSRLCEELVVWSSAEFGFVRMSDAVTTGSSLMPQKRNPDVAELIRGKSGRLVGDLVSLLVILKGLPLSYNRDLQEDKEPLFDAADTWQACLVLAEKLLRACRFNREQMAAAARDPGMLATELADYLVRKGLPFRQAHEVVGAVVAAGEREGRTLVDFTASELKNFSDLFGADAARVLDPRRAVESRTLTGGPSTQAVDAQIARIERALTPVSRVRRGQAAPSARTRKKSPRRKRG